MPKTITLQDSKELRVAKNFLIISILLLVMDFLSALLFVKWGTFLIWFDLILQALFLVSNITGIYQLAKVARSHILFKNYMILILGSALIVLAFVLIVKLSGIQIFDLKNFATPSALSDDEKLFISILGFKSLLLLVLFVYCGYRICKEMTSLSGDEFFMQGFKTIVFSFGSLILGNVAMMMGAGFGQILVYLGLISMLIGFFLIVSGVFRLKKITISES